MSIKLPDIIAAYFDADRARSADAVAECFTEGAVVRDEGQSHSGRDAIRQWKRNASKKYTYTAEPISIATDGDRTVVVCHLEGDFPGSPLDLRYQFLIDHGKIARLEITLSA